MQDGAGHLALRWGILGAARIAGKALIPAIRKTGGEIVAVAASDLERAKSFAGEHEIESAYGNYAAVLSDPGLNVLESAR